MLDFLAQAEVLGLWQLDMPHLLKPMGGLLLSEPLGRRGKLGGGGRKGVRGEGE